MDFYVVLAKTGGRVSKRKRCHKKEGNVRVKEDWKLGICLENIFYWKGFQRRNLKTKRSNLLETAFSSFVIFII